MRYTGLATDPSPEPDGHNDIKQEHGVLVESDMKQDLDVRDTMSPRGVIRLKKVLGHKKTRKALQKERASSLCGDPSMIVPHEHELSHSDSDDYETFETTAQEMLMEFRMKEAISVMRHSSQLAQP